MSNLRDSKYDKLEKKFADLGQKIVDDFGVNKSDLKDIIEDRVDE